ncbi:Hypothetical predicted protein [Scomber scombrus]|uniref:Uncharacterized protein n=1 Tax=Scomber scombrus TaxID=13677 RepID=A0AAV1NEC9_SCOSC
MVEPLRMAGFDSACPWSGGNGAPVHIQHWNYRAAMFQPGEELQNHNHTLNWTDCILQCLTLVLFIHKRHSFLNHKLDHT